MSEQTPDTTQAPIEPDPAPAFNAQAEVAADLQGGVDGYLNRARNSDIGAEQMEESARRERALAEEYREKAEVLRGHLRTLGVVSDPGVTA